MKPLTVERLKALLHECPHLLPYSWPSQAHNRAQIDSDYERAAQYILNRQEGDDE